MYIVNDSNLVMKLLNLLKTYHNNNVTIEWNCKDSVYLLYK